ncbi:MAG: SMC-Scp complex subunit ScpB [Micavibrio sp.]|nr:SMC-Scp complex subunit ScpB [Micavibrio sp.]|tara:strand:+ start:831 stop:1451 length:621 start_codon:yes stop_codon:yes gene_type:complete
MSIDLDLQRKVEAILFAAKEPLTVEQIEVRLPQGTDVRAILRALKDTYETRGFTLTQSGNHWAFRTAADLSDILEHQKEEQRQLSRAAMETLAIVAYHQPVTRAEIENIRGVATSKGTLDILMEAGWVKPGRRRQVPGKPLTWITSEDFLDHFGLETIMELPGVEELKASGLLDKRPAIETIPGTPNMFEEEELTAQQEAQESENT